MVWYEASIYETGDFQTELEEIQLLLQDEMRQLGGGKPILPLEQLPTE